MTPAGSTGPSLGSSRGRALLIRPWMVAVAVGTVAAVFAMAFEGWDSRIQERGAAAGALARPRTALESTIGQRVALLRGMAAQLSVHWGETTPDVNRQFDEFADRLGLGVSEGIISFQYVRNGIIAHSWPAEGNEPAVGRDLRTHVALQVREDYQRSVETPPGQLSLSTPTELYQGGRGVIGRTRVDIPGDSVVVLAAVVLDLRTMLELSGLSDTAGYHWQLRDQDGTRMAGEPDSGWVARMPVTLPVRLIGRTWQLQSAPLSGWGVAVTQRQIAIRAGLAVAVLLLALLGYLYQSSAMHRLESSHLRQLAQVEEQFSLLFQLVPDGVFVVRTSDDRVVKVNDAYCTITGRSRNEHLGRTVQETEVWANPDDRERGLVTLRETGRLMDFPFLVRRPDGSQRETLVASRVVDLHDGPHFLTVVRDVHDRVLLERRLAASQRLEAVGRLAGGIAHDFNNLLTGITGYAEELLLDLPPDHRNRAEVEEILRAGGRAAGLTKQLLTFARRQVVLPRRLDLNRLVREVEPLLRRLATPAVALRVDLDPSSCSVLIDPTQFEQVLTNFTINARDAMPDGGEIRITTSREGDMVVLEVRDEGTGIPDEAMPHLFEPFYTTKPAGKGTGLGLPTVYGIVSQAGGRIEVKSALNRGSTFRVMLPRADGALEPESESPEAALPGGNELVLLVEDEPQVLELGTRILGRLGYRVLTASDGRAALAMLAEHPSVHLVITDMIMPGMGGVALLQYLKEHHPYLPVLITSGYSDELPDVVQEGEFVPKPFTRRQLAMAVRQALDS